MENCLKYLQFIMSTVILYAYMYTLRGYALQGHLMDA